MLAEPRSGTEAAQALAVQLGCTAAEHFPSFGLPHPAVVGASPQFATQLKAHGGRRNRVDRMITFGTWPQLEGVLQAIAARSPEDAQ